MNIQYDMPILSLFLTDVINPPVSLYTLSFKDLYYISLANSVSICTELSHCLLSDEIQLCIHLGQYWLNGVAI